MQTFKTRCKLCKMDFSKTASNGEFSNNLQWCMTLLCLKFAPANLHPRTTRQSCHQLEQSWLYDSFHCCKLRREILANKLRTDRRKATSSTCSTLQQKCGVTGKNKNCLKVYSKCWTKKRNWWDCSVHLLHMVTWGWFEHCRQQDIQLYSKATILLGKSFKLLHCSSWLNSKRQRLWSKKRGTQIITDIIQSIRHLDLEVKAH